MPTIVGELKMNKLLLASQFQVDAEIELVMIIGKDEFRPVGSLSLMMNLQADDQE